MKKLLFSAIAMSTMFINQLGAKPIEWHVSGTVEIGRPKKGCEKIWLCLKVTDWEVKLPELHRGNPSSDQHGIGMGKDGNLYMIISERLLLATQREKIAFLRGQSTYNLDSEEMIPQAVLNKVKYTGGATIRAGAKEVSYENGYYFSKLN